MTDRLVLHEYAASGNCYKVRLTAAIAGVRLERREYDIMKGETRTPKFLASVNANGRIPLHPGKQRRLLFRGRRLAAHPDGSVRPRRHAALDVLRTV